MCLLWAAASVPPLWANTTRILAVEGAEAYELAASVKLVEDGG